MQFFTETMHAFNKMIGDYLKKELGCKQLVNAGNWRTADNVTMLDAERWSYTANEVMAVNRYYGGAHEGQNNGWAIVNGDRFTDDCAMLHPREMPLTLKQVDGFPMMITESSWVPPQGYQSEGPFLVAAYQSLTGIDAYYWFATGEEDWRQPGSANGFLPSEGKWVCATPMLMGQWPAAALMYRLGYIKQGEPVVYEQRSLADLWRRRMPIIAEDAGYDPNRDKANMSKESNVKDGVNPLAYLVGPVVVKYGGDPSKSRAVDLSPYHSGGQEGDSVDHRPVVHGLRQGAVRAQRPQGAGRDRVPQERRDRQVRRRRDPVRQRLRDRAGRRHGRQAAEKLRQDPGAGRHHGAPAGLEDQAGPGQAAARAKKW